MVTNCKLQRNEQQETGRTFLNSPTDYTKLDLNTSWHCGVPKQEDLVCESTVTPIRCFYDTENKREGAEESIHMKILILLGIKLWKSTASRQINQQNRTALQESQLTQKVTIWTEWRVSLYYRNALLYAWCTSDHPRRTTTRFSNKGEQMKILFRKKLWVNLFVNLTWGRPPRGQSYVLQKKTWIN